MTQHSKLARLYEVSPVTAARTADWPLFVFTAEIAELLSNGDAAHKSLEAMIAAGVAHLPYPVMLVQYPCGPAVTCIAAVSEHDDGEFRATSYFIDDANKAYSIPQAAVTFKFAAGYKITADSTIKVWVHAAGSNLDRQAQNAYANHAVIAVRLGILMSHIAGLEREHVPAPEKLNKQREKKGKPAIKGYSYIHVAKVYDRDGTAHARTGTGRHMPIHMRAGHVRTQHFGKGNEETKLIWIKPVLVNYKPEDGKPVPRIEKRVIA